MHYAIDKELQWYSTAIVSWNNGGQPDHEHNTETSYVHRNNISMCYLNTTCSSLHLYM